MADSNGTVSADFNPFRQSFNLSMKDGSQFEVNITDLDYYRTYAIRICINFASQIGASLILLVVLFVLTRREKRAAPVFVLNAACLLVNAIRTILQSLYYTGPFYNPFAYLSADYSQITASDKGISIAANTLTLMLVMLVMTSLILQVRVMLITAPKIQRFWTMLVSIVVALVTIGLRFALVVFNNVAIMNIESFYDYQWLLNAVYIMQAIAIWFFCVIFVVKLGFALSQRKKLGIQQLGPMQIIFIMGCQTMVIPGKPPFQAQTKLKAITNTQRSHLHRSQLRLQHSGVCFADPHRCLPLPPSFSDLGQHRRRRSKNCCARTGRTPQAPGQLRHHGRYQQHKLKLDFRRLSL